MFKEFLPGIRFEPARQVLDETLPRMDIALFVGFAQIGEFNTPTPIEDVAQFEKQFGGDVALGWDEVRNETAWSYLGAAVRTFFLNGGQRCWVVRVWHEANSDARPDIASDLFWDARLGEAVSVNGLQTQADFFLAQHGPDLNQKVKFDGIHALLNPMDFGDMTEVTLIAVPDAVYLGWTRELSTHDNAPDPQESQPVEHPDWWTFLGCPPVPVAQLPPNRAQPDHAEFLASNVRVWPPPEFEKDDIRVNKHGSFTVSWSWQAPTDAPTLPEFVLEEARMADWSDAAEIYVGAVTHLKIWGRAVGAYYYRVRVRTQANSSPYSNGIKVQVRPGKDWRMSAPDPDAPNAALLALHRALLLVCATRGDCLAVLSLPLAHREAQARIHAQTLRDAVAGKPQGSFGALYHPWLVGRDGDTQEAIRIIPPDGAACGMMAARALRRGVWVSPGNEILHGVFALQPPLQDAQRLSLQHKHINIIRQEPRGFVVLSADTLADDDHPELRPINVRRLLCLLRRVVLRRGPQFVFEPNNDTFRRMVQRSFEVLLARMFAQGAFAGRIPSQAYRVVADASVNTPQRIDQGQFVVELRIAPSLPLKFLSVVLLHSQDKTVVREGN